MGVPSSLTELTNLADDDVFVVEDVSAVSNAVKKGKLSTLFSYFTSKRNHRQTVALAGGSTHGFAGIPAGVNRIALMFSGASLSGTDNVLVQIGGSGGYETTGYESASALQDGTGNAITNSTTGFLLFFPLASNTTSGMVTLSRLDGNTWALSGNLAHSNTQAAVCAGAKTLSAELDRIRITTTASDTFDAGQAGIFAEI